MDKIIDFVLCPITNSSIDIGLCQDIQNVADEAVSDSVLEFKISDIQKNICTNCKKRVNPSL